MAFGIKFYDLIKPKQGEKDKKNRQSQGKTEWVLGKQGLPICQVQVLAENMKHSETVITGFLKCSFLVGDLQSESLKYFHGSGAF